jgi:hypothetical protein
VLTKSDNDDLKPDGGGNGKEVTRVFVNGDDDDSINGNGDRNDALYLITFGLISLVINGALLLFVAWLSSLLDGGTFSIDGFTTTGLSIESFGWAILGALIMSVASFISRGLFKVLRIL